MSSQPKAGAHPSTGPDALPGNRTKYFGTMRAVITFSAVAILVQGFTAGRLLSGADGGRTLHETTGSLVVIGLVAVVVSAAAVRRNGGPILYAYLGLLLLVLTVVQILLGQDGRVAAHVPLGVSLACGSAVLAYKAWTSDR